MLLFTGLGAVRVRRQYRDAVGGPGAGQDSAGAGTVVGRGGARPARRPRRPAADEPREHGLLPLGRRRPILGRWLIFSASAGAVFVSRPAGLVLPRHGLEPTKLHPPEAPPPAKIPALWRGATGGVRSPARLPAPHLAVSYNFNGFFPGVGAGVPDPAPGPPETRFGRFFIPTVSGMMAGWPCRSGSLARCPRPDRPGDGHQIRRGHQPRRHQSDGAGPAPKWCCPSCCVHLRHGHRHAQPDARALDHFPPTGARFQLPELPADAGELDHRRPRRPHPVDLVGGLAAGMLG